VMIPIILIRSVKGVIAHLVVLDALAGGESAENWEEAFSRIPPGVRRRIVALVSDEHRTLSAYAVRQGWIHQVCTVHVKARFHHWLPRWERTSFREECRQAWEAAKTVCDDPNMRHVRAALHTLQDLGRCTGLPTLLRKHSRGLSREWRSCRSYLDHPELRLPDTSNVVESVASIIREMLAKRRGFRTRSSLRLWLRLIQKMHPTVTCNPAKTLQN
jgi:transposase-like protein